MSFLRIVVSMLTLVLCTLVLNQGVHASPTPPHFSEQVTKHSQPVSTTGTWLRDVDGKIMADPQTSALVHWRDGLLTLSDRSALVSHQLHIHQLSMERKQVLKSMPVVFDDTIKQSCFAEYLMGSPDLEAMAVLPSNDKELIIITEDASSAQLIGDCQLQYDNTGYTPYPPLLVRLQLQDNQRWLANGVRPLRFTPEHKLANYPNDGFEGLAFGPNNQLYLALEKDGDGQPRIFHVNINQQFWQTQGFVDAVDPELHTPRFEAGNHPINGLTYFHQREHDTHWLIAAARNDDQLWLIDIDKKQPTRVIDVTYFAPLRDKSAQCKANKAMYTSGIEGAAVVGQQLWLVNDPWKQKYPLNIQCEADAATYQQFSPLLWTIPLTKLFSQH